MKAHKLAQKRHRKALKRKNKSHDKNKLMKAFIKRQTEVVESEQPTQTLALPETQTITFS